MRDMGNRFRRYNNLSTAYFRANVFESTRRDMILGYTNHEIVGNKL